MGHDDNLDLFLQGLGLEKYVHLFNKKDINFDTFINMTVEDMEMIGITNEEDKIKLCDASKPLQYLYKDTNELMSINEQLIMAHESNQTRNILSKLILLKRTLVSNEKPKNILVDEKTPTSKAIMILVDKLLNSVELIEQDMTKTLKRKKNITPYYIVGTVMAAGILMFYGQKFIKT